MAEYLFTITDPDEGATEVVIGRVSDVQSLHEAVERLQTAIPAGETVTAYRIANGPRHVRFVEETVRRMEVA